MTRTILVLIAVVLAAGAAFTLWLPQQQAEPVTLSDARLLPMDGRPGNALLFVTITNGDAPDTLIGAASAVAQTVEIAGATGPLAIPAKGTPSLAADGAHLMLSGVEDALEQGQLVPITLTFERFGTVMTKALVGPSADPHAQHMAAMNGVRMDPAPTLSLSANAAEGGGWQVTAKVQNFTFETPSETPQSVPGEGHGHLYLNGLKLQRMYSDTAQIGALPEGRHALTMTLNTGMHQPYMGEAGPVRATAEITVD